MHPDRIPLTTIALPTAAPAAAVSLILALMAVPAGATDQQMYRCQDGDDVTFSQAPCGDNAREVSVEYTEPSESEAAAASARAASQTAAARKAAAADDREQRIAAKEREIQDLKAERDRAVGELAVERQHGTEDRADDTYRLEKRVEMQGVMDDYNTRIEDLEAELSDLRQR